MKAERIVIAGAGGHAKVVAEAIGAMKGLALAGAVDRGPDAARASGLKFLGTDDALPALLKKGVRYAAVGMGSIRCTKPRRKLFEKLVGLGFSLPPVVHPKAAVSPSAKLGPGCQVLAGAVVNPDARLGANCVVNTAAVVEHDCEIGAHAFIGPGARLAGAVVLGAEAFVGLGALILQGVRIGAGSVVGAGAVVLEDVPPGKVVAGMPAKVIGDA